MNRARSFFFVCLGILCIVAAYHFGATSAKAQASSQYRVVGWHSDGGMYVAVGSSLYYLAQGSWAVEHGPSGSLPVPTDQIAWYNGSRIMTTAGEGWSYGGYSGWLNAGPPPGVTAASGASWGQVKARYAK